MANEQQLEIIKQGAKTWNEWRKKHKEDKIDLCESDLSGVDLAGVNLIRSNLRGTKLNEANLKRAILYGANLYDAKLRGAKLIEVNISKATLYKCDLTKADLSKAILHESNFSEANFTGAKLIGASLCRADLGKAILTEADLTGANLRESTFVETNIDGAIMTGCKIYGISVWGINGAPKDQSKLIITNEKEAEISVDDLQVAQFVYLLLNRENLRNVLNTITSKAVLILGRFTAERKEILNGLADELRKHNLLPMMFDFERSTSRDFTETDITNPKCAPLELQATVPDYEIPFAPIIQKNEEPFAMFKDLARKQWVLPLITYSSLKAIQLAFKDMILNRAIEKQKKLQLAKAKEIQVLSADDYLNSAGLG